MKSQTRKVVLVISVIALASLVFAGVAVAQAPGPDRNGGWLGQMQGWMDQVHGPGSWGQMIQHMNEVHGPEFTGQMLRWMNETGGCHGDDARTGGMMRGGQPGMMGWR